MVSSRKMAHPASKLSGAARISRILLAVPLLIFFAATARAESWYLMTADAKVMSESDIVTTLSQGSKVGPIPLKSSAQFPSRESCEAARPDVINAWRKDSVMAKGSWNRHGYSSPTVFILCISDNDPRLAKSPSSTENPRSMDLWLKPKGIRRIN
jgi:hypothetical protein